MQYRAEAESGNLNAQYFLGVSYRDGNNGVEKDAKTAMAWLRKAAVQDHVGAQFDLACQLFFGDGVPEDTAEAVKWLERCAKADFDSGQFFFFFCLRFGLRNTRRLRWSGAAKQQKVHTQAQPMF